MLYCFFLQKDMTKILQNIQHIQRKYALFKTKYLILPVVRSIVWIIKQVYISYL